MVAQKDRRDLPSAKRASSGPKLLHCHQGLLALVLKLALGRSKKKLNFVNFGRSASLNCGKSSRTCSELPLPAYSVEKHGVVTAGNGAKYRAQAPLPSGFLHLLRCRKDLGQFPEVLGGSCEQEFVICATWTT